MKAMTCIQMGGCCDELITGSTPEEMKVWMDKFMADYTALPEM